MAPLLRYDSLTVGRNRKHAETRENNPKLYPQIPKTGVRSLRSAVNKDNAEG